MSCNLSLIDLNQLVTVGAWHFVAGVFQLIHPSLSNLHVHVAKRIAIRAPPRATARSTVTGSQIIS